jgi:hypothetical protein
MKLYDIPFEIASFETEIEANEGVITPKLEARWKEFISAGKDKIEAGAMVIQTLKAQAEACEAEAKRLQKRADSLSANVERLKQLTIGAVDSFGGKVKTPLFTIWTQDSAATLSIETAPDADLKEMEEYMPEFVRTQRELNKKAIAEKIKAGPDWEIPPCLNVTEKPGTHYLRIR